MIYWNTSNVGPCRKTALSFKDMTRTVSRLLQLKPTAKIHREKTRTASIGHWPTAQTWEKGDSNAQHNSTSRPNKGQPQNVRGNVFWKSSPKRNLQSTNCHTRGVNASAVRGRAPKRKAMKISRNPGKISEYMCTLLHDNTFEIGWGCVLTTDLHPGILEHTGQSSHVE